MLFGCEYVEAIGRQKVGKGVGAIRVSGGVCFLRDESPLSAIVFVGTFIGQQCGPLFCSIIRA